MTEDAVSAPNRLAKSPEFLSKLQELRRTDNFTNAGYIVFLYGYFAVVIGGSLWFFHHRAELGLSFGWTPFVAFLAIVAVGAGQHQLTGLAHEASHYTLFRNRLWNEIASDFFCMFPMFSSTHQYRLQHLAHHQYTNDPDLDPDVAQLRWSGHWFGFPLRPSEFLGKVAFQLQPHRLVKYVLGRARFAATGAETGPFALPGGKASPWLGRFAFAYLLVSAATLRSLVLLGDVRFLAAAPVVMAAVGLAFYGLAPARWFPRTRLRPVYGARITWMLRCLFFTGLLGGIAWATFTTRLPVGGYVILLWIVPILTSFGFFMLLRQLVQHGNSDRGFLTNTRVFLVSPLLRWAVFPMGQDYHLPHHMYASVPHYRLKKLHELLLEQEDYRRNAVV
ncbi:MAG: fatty acid desaturase family protein, partial [Planctomycetia bacterium]